MSKNAIAFLAGMGEGYLNAQDKERTRARQEKIDKITFDNNERMADEHARNLKNQAALADAGKDLVLNENAATLDTSGKPVLYEDADVAASDYRQARQLQARNIAQTLGANFVGSAPKPTFSVGGQSFAERGLAQSAVDAGNTSFGRTGRMANTLYAQGKPMEAMQLETSARQGKLADIQLSQAEQAQAHDKAFRQITEGIARGGWGAVPDIYKNYKDGNTAQVAEDGKGGATVTALNAKGEQVGKKVFANQMDFITTAVARLDPAKWIAMQQAEKDKAGASGLANQTAAQIRPRNTGITALEDTGLVRGDAGGRRGGASPAAAATENTNRYVQQTVMRDLQAAAANPAKYAQVYAKAVQVAKPEQLTAWGFKPPAAQAAKAPTPRQSELVPAAPAAPAMTSAPPRQNAALPPVELAGQALDRAREELHKLRTATRPGLAAGRQAMDAYAASLQAAQTMVAQREAEYQKLLPAQSASFAAQR